MRASLTSDIVSLSAGRAMTCARLRDGTVDCWGSLIYSTTAGVVSQPSNLTGLKDVAEIAVSSVTDVRARLWAPCAAGA